MNKLAITLASAVLISVAACSQKSEPQQPQTTAPAQPPVQQPMQQPEAPQVQPALVAPASPQTNLSAGGHPAGVPMQMNSAPQAGANGGQGKVLQSMHASSYTFIEVDMGGKKTWIATNAMPVNTGATVRWRDGAVMQNFTSNALRRTFDEIIFVSYAEVAK